MTKFRTLFLATVFCGGALGAVQAQADALADITVAVQDSDSVEATATRVLDALRAHRPDILEPA